MLTPWYKETRQVSVFDRTHYYPQQIYSFSGMEREAWRECGMSSTVWYHDGF